MPKHPSISIDLYTPYLINRAAVAMVEYAAPGFENHGLTVPTWRILFALSEQGPCFVGDLLGYTSIEGPTLSRALLQLSRRHLIRRKRDPADGRFIKVTLTAAGRALVARSVPYALRCEQVYLKGLTQDEVATLRRAVTVIYENARMATSARERHERAEVLLKRPAGRASRFLGPPSADTADTARPAVRRTVPKPRDPRGRRPVP